MNTDPKEVERRPLDESGERRFMAKVQPEPMSGCWLWDAAVDPRGYGRFGLGSREAGTALAHRVAYAQWVGAIPRGQCVCHKCDTPECVNPDHMFLGTRTENNEDMRAKGRGAKPPVRMGSRHHRARLTEPEVLAIRAMTAVGVPLALIADRFGVSAAHVSSIKRGKCWAHVGKTAATSA